MESRPTPEDIRRDALIAFLGSGMTHALAKAQLVQARVSS